MGIFIFADHLLVTTAVTALSVSFDQDVFLTNLSSCRVSLRKKETTEIMLNTGRGNCSRHVLALILLSRVENCCGALVGQFTQGYIGVP